MKEGIIMKVKVNQEKCIGCGACPSLVPEVFDFNDDGLAHVIVDQIPEELEEQTIEALENCPVGAIEKTNE